MLVQFCIVAYGPKQISQLSLLMGNPKQKMITPTAFLKWQRNDYFTARESNAEVGRTFAFAMCRENGDAMHKSTVISRPAYSI